MRQNIKDFTGIVSKTLPIIEPIYEFGSFQVPEQIGFADLRPLFQHKKYVGCDMREGPGVDEILDLHAIDLPSNSVGTVLCFDTLEHVEYPRKALEEIQRILKPGGIAVISSVMDFPIHDHPHDYWRFTPEAFKSILKIFSNSFVGFQGKESYPHTIVGIGFKGNMQPPTAFTEMYNKWQRADDRSIRQIVLKLTPPIFLPIVAWIHRTATGLTSSSN
ncbi:MAG: methyltransferase domain-containing protein [Desulfatitalea sp.]